LITIPNSVRTESVNSGINYIFTSNLKLVKFQWWVQCFGVYVRGAKSGLNRFTTLFSGLDPDSPVIPEIKFVSWLVTLHTCRRISGLLKPKVSNQPLVSKIPSIPLMIVLTERHASQKK